MAESSTTSPETVPELDLLVTTKFHVPRAGFVPRPRLLARLAQGMERGLTLVCTPAGFGKTTLLGDWARRSHRPTAWLSLDAGDNDPARFWRYVAEALDRVRPGVSEQVAPLLRGPQQPPSEAVATKVINDMASVPEQVTLVLDDYHLIEASPVHESVAFLLERLPSGLRLVLASRADPPLPLARLRARGQLAELRATELRFSLDETAALLREATGFDLPTAAIAALQERTEGWVAGVQLAALSLQGHPDPAGFIATFAGSNRFVLDYLTEEVLSRQPEQVVRFLLETSVLERLSGPLCDAVTNETGGQARLEALERANLFVVPLDEVRRWWRYHHLFADLLRVRLAQERPERVPELHRAAAAWHEEHGSADDAVRHALAAGEVDWAARLVERHVEALLRRSEGATLRRWLGGLPAETLRARARLCLAQAITAVVGSRVEAIEPLLVDAERAFAASGDEPHEPSCGRALSVLANVPASIAFLRAELARLRGDAERAVDFDQQALGHLGEPDWLLRSLVAWNLAVADWLRGRLEPAEHVLAEVVAERQAAGEGYLAMRVCYDLGQVQRAQGRLDAALATYRRGLEPVNETGSELPAAGILHVGLAEVLYEQDELAAALDHATQSVALCRQLAFTQSLATGLAILARIRQAQGDANGALDAIEQAEQVELSPQVVALLNPVPVWRAGLLLGRGEVAEAARWANERGLSAADEPSYPREGEYLVLARVLLAQREPDRALGLLERLHAQAVDEERTGSVIELGALRALALEARGDDAAALTALAEALVLAGPAGYARVFVDHGGPMAHLLGRLAAAHRTGRVELPSSVPPDHLDRLARAFKPDGAYAASRADRDTAGVEALVEPLSDRELEVLGLLAAGKSNQQIADELFVVLDTVKKHVGRILAKLGAANRTQAVARAR
ncbi:MAG TPA: LuxR C-terminal-related transcriptional regulator, partial [Gemmatimonadales bacterium]|nr:LuxR C-terminal-related transcriptional regulator [Gemmatimonadales bacterium]